jgi:hypothetical protein
LQLLNHAFYGWLQISRGGGVADVRNGTFDETDVGSMSENEVVQQKARRQGAYSSYAGVDEFMGGREKGGYLIRQYPGIAVFLSGDAVSKECDFARSGLQITCQGR